MQIGTLLVSDRASLDDGAQGNDSVMTMDEIVDNYIREHRPRGQEEAHIFRNSATLAEAIGHALRPGGYKHPHQYLIKPSLLDEAEHRLRRAEAKLMLAVDFADLFGLIEREVGSIHGVGELAIYDIAYRIGVYLGKAPAVVYLHRGTRRGAAVLGFRGRTLDPKLLPDAFSRLTSAEIEDCLCIYEHELAGSGLGTRAPAVTSRCLPERRRIRSKC